MDISGKFIDFINSTFANDVISVIVSILVTVFGFVLLIKGADFFVDGASKIAEKLRIPLIVIGLTIVAFGTSAPEAAISITSATQGNAGISIGNIIGSNTMNILIILGMSSLMCALPVNKNTFRFEIPFVVVISAVLLLIGIIGDGFQLYDAFILIALFVIFFVYLIRISKNGGGNEQSSLTAKDTVPKMILMIVAGLVMIVLGSDFTVAGASEIAERLGVEQRIIGLTIVAFGTSLPELVTSVAAARKGKTDIAVGNIIGSNIFNILFVGGLAILFSSVHPVQFSNFIIDTIVTIAAAVILWLCLLKDKKLGKAEGVIMLVLYAGYFVYLILQPQIIA